jgi:hypothetical protein
VGTLQELREADRSLLADVSVTTVLIADADGVRRSVDVAP